MKDKDDVLKGAAFSALGAYGIYWMFQQPCNISPIPGIPEQLLQVMCFSSEAKLMIVSIVASALLFNGVSKIVKNI